jgi:membrane-associated phospholipid phosphatase
MTILWPFEIPIIILIQNIGSWLAPFMHFFSFLGTEEFFLLILSALYWCIDSTIGLRVALSLLISNTVNGYLKLALRGARPYWFDSSIKGLSHESSFGIPSGHAQNSMVVWGTIALGFRKRWITIICCLAVFLVGFSRIYLGVHWISDVLTGWTIGLIILWMVAKMEKPVVTWWVSRSFPFQIFLSIGFSVVIIFIGVLWQSAFKGWQVPLLWQQNVTAAFPGALIDPAPRSDTYTLAGLWLGMLIGASLIHKVGGYQPPARFGQKLLAYLIGLIGVMIFWYGLGAIFPRTEELFSYGLRYLRYALVGFWIIALAPLVFRKLKISIK